MPDCERKRQPIVAGTGVPLVTYVAILSRDYSMLKSKKSALGVVTRSHSALAFLAATFLVGGSITEASAKSRHHHHHHSHHAAKTTEGKTTEGKTTEGKTTEGSS